MKKILQIALGLFLVAVVSCRWGKKQPMEGELLVSEKIPSERVKDDAKFLKKLNRDLKKEQKRLEKLRRKQARKRK